MARTADDRRVVVITGASAGVGRATAVMFAETERAKIGLIARGREGLEAAAREIRAFGGDALVLPCDVADAAALDRAADEVEQTFGPIDVWVNDAMTAVLAEVWDTTPEEFRRVMDVTFLGSVHGAQTALRRMLPRDRGVIIQVGSALGRRGIPLQATYCAAKHAIQGFVESLRTELLHRGSHVRLSLVQLPGLNTTQFGWVRARTPNAPRPVAPVYQPTVAARAIVHASHHPRREYWVGRSTVMTIVGNWFAPWLVDRYLAKTAYDGQQTDQPIDGRPDDLFTALDETEDRGTYGPFDDEAWERSPQAMLSRHRGAIAAAGLAGAAAALAAGRR